MSKFVIESALTCDEPEITPEGKVAISCVDPEITPFVAFITPLNDVAVDAPIVVSEPVI